MSNLLQFSEHTLQEVALLTMATVYTIRIIWLLRFKAGRDRQAPTGTPGYTTPRKGVLWSWAIIAMPWAMESQRRHLFFYLQFALFHIGVTMAIGLSIVIPYAPQLLELVVLQRLLQLLIGAAFLIGVLRMIRRISQPHMRAISSPDDYFSLGLLTVWFLFAFLSVPNSTATGEWHLIIYFMLTAVFLFYVPFSKISHYLYYPFTRYYLGKSLGHRGVFPIKRSVVQSTAMRRTGSGANLATSVGAGEVSP